MWILNRLEIARQRADLMFGSIAEDGSLGYVPRFFYRKDLFRYFYSLARILASALDSESIEMD